MRTLAVSLIAVTLLPAAACCQRTVRGANGRAVTVERKGGQVTIQAKDAPGLRVDLNVGGKGGPRGESPGLRRRD